MGTSQARPVASHASATAADAPFDDVLQAVGRIASSTEPAVVFSSVARLCAPLICTRASVTISASGEQAHLISWPKEIADSQLEATTDAVRIEFASASDDGLSYHGALTLHTGPRDDDRLQVLGQLIVDRATAIVARARSAEQISALTARADNLAIALASNREIGMAVGILMATHKMTSDQAFDVLSQVSQHTNRKVRAIALDVIHTGALEIPVCHAVAPTVGRS